jgi:hypothetical protein
LSCNLPRLVAKGNTQDGTQAKPFVALLTVQQVQVDDKTVFLLLQKLTLQGKGGFAQGSIPSGFV